METTVQAARLTVRPRKASFSFERLHKQWRSFVEQRRRPRKRRSKTRLREYEKSVSRLKFNAEALAPARDSLRFHGSTIFNVLFLGLLGWGLTWLFASDQFYVNQISVTGNQRVSTAAILEASGIQGYSIFWVDARQVAADIVGALPPVKRVRVQYGLPNSIALIVEERGAQVMWQVAGRRYWVDDDGYLHPVLHQTGDVSPAQGGDEPKLLVNDIRPGLPTLVDVEAVVAARQIVHLLPELRAMEYAPVTGLRFTHPRGWVVYLGTGDDMARKVSILRAMEVQFAGGETAQPSLVDLRFPDSPYYRLPAEVAEGM